MTYTWMLDADIPEFYQDSFSTVHHAVLDDTHETVLAIIQLLNSNITVIFSEKETGDVHTKRFTDFNEAKEYAESILNTRIEDLERKDFRGSVRKLN